MKILVALATLLLAAPASADLWVHGCTEANVDCTAANVPYDCCTGATAGTCPVTQTTGIVGSQHIKINEAACYTFDNADGTTESDGFTVSTDSAFVTFDSDTNAAGAQGGVITLRHCPANVKPAAPVTPANQCPSFGTFDGTEGSSAVQNQSERVGPGVYYFDITTVCTAGDHCRAVIRGERNLQ